MSNKKRWTQAEVEQLLKDAQNNEGLCSNCWRKLAIYRYTANRQMAVILKRLAAATHDNQKTAIDVDTLALAYSQRTQLTKLRFHGLAAKVKDKEGHQTARHWVVTNKGWGWVKGEPIERRVIVFDNQLLGHEGGPITITEALGEKPAATHYDQKPVTEAEAKVYRNARTPQRHTIHQAEYRGYSNEIVARGETYTIHIERLQVGRPVKVNAVVRGKNLYKCGYNDIAAFQRAWKIIS